MLTTTNGGHESHVHLVNESHLCNCYVSNSTTILELKDCNCYMRNSSTFLDLKKCFLFT